MSTTLTLEEVRLLIARTRKNILRRGAKVGEEEYLRDLQALRRIIMHREAREEASSMSAAKQCKHGGLTGMKQLSDITGVNYRTLFNWHRDRPALFKVVIAGAVMLR